MEPIETIEYKGYDINIYYDQLPANPFEEWDCEPPLLVHHDGRTTEYGLSLSVPELTREEIKQNLIWIKGRLEVSSLLRLKGTYKDYYSSSDDFVEFLNDQIRERVEEGSISEQMELIAELYQMKGIPAEVKTVTGYVQSHWAEVLCVLTPDWVKEVGVPDDHLEAAMDGTFKLYADWAFGNVYGFEVEDSEGDELDSCWGYYGDEHEETGLLETARQAVDCEIEARRRVRQSRLKGLVRARVPLPVRLDIMEAMR